MEIEHGLGPTERRPRMKWITGFVLCLTLVSGVAATANGSVAGGGGEETRYKGGPTLTQKKFEIVSELLAEAGAPASLDQIAGHTVVISTGDLLGDFYFYRVTGGNIFIGKIILYVECGSKYQRDWVVRELYFKSDPTKSGWSLVYYKFDPRKPEHLERYEVQVELWWPGGTGPERTKP